MACSEAARNDPLTWMCEGAELHCSARNSALGVLLYQSSIGFADPREMKLWIPTKVACPVFTPFFWRKGGRAQMPTIRHRAIRFLFMAQVHSCHKTHKTSWTLAPAGRPSDPSHPSRIPRSMDRDSIQTNPRPSRLLAPSRKRAEIGNDQAANHRMRLYLMKVRK